MSWPRRVSDPVDGARLVVREEERPVRKLEEVDRPPPRALSVKEPFEEGLVRDRLAPLQPDEHHAIADLPRAVPRTVLGDEDLTAVLRREHGAPVELHPQRGDVRTKPLLRGDELRARPALAEAVVGEVASVTVRIPEVEPGSRRAVQLVGRLVVPHPVTAVVGEPELLRVRAPPALGPLPGPPRRSRSCRASRRRASLSRPAPSSARREPSRNARSRNPAEGGATRSEARRGPSPRRKRRPRRRFRAG